MTNNELLIAISDMLDQKLEEKLEQKLEEKLEKKLDEKLDKKLDEKFEQKLAPINKQLKDIGQKVEQIDTRLGKVEEKVEQIDARLGKVEEKVEQIDARLGKVEDRLECVENTVENEVLPMVFKVDQDVRKLKLIYENDFLPRLQNIEGCYLSTYKRYQDSVLDYEAMKLDIQVLKRVVMEHSEKLQKIS